MLDNDTEYLANFSLPTREGQKFTTKQLVEWLKAGKSRADFAIKFNCAIQTVTRRITNAKQAKKREIANSE